MKINFSGRLVVTNSKPSGIPRSFNLYFFSNYAIHFAPSLNYFNANLPLTKLTDFILIGLNLN